MHIQEAGYREILDKLACHAMDVPLIAALGLAAVHSHARCTRTVCAGASQQTRSKTTNAVEFERYIESRRSCRESSAAGGWMTADGRAAATERQRRATHRPVCSVALLRRPLTATATTLRPLAAHSLAVAQHLPSTDLLGAGCKVKSVNRFRRDFHHASVRSIGSDRDTTDMNAVSRVFCRNALAELVPVLSYGACARSEVGQFGWVLARLWRHGSF